MTLPLNLPELRQQWNAGQHFELFLFYGHKPPAHGVDESCLSQWFARSFEVQGQSYPTAEHWMMAEKARLFGDDEMLCLILDSDSPRDAKAYGRKVSGFDSQVWDQHKFDLVFRGNLEKFSQNKDLKTFLLGSANQSRSRRVAEEPADYKTDKVAEALPTYKFENYSKQHNRTQTERTSSPVIFVEAAGRDTIWGIGLGRNNPKSQDPMQWRGKNLLGFALTKVREHFLNE